jgi:hypothetical protein
MTSRPGLAWGFARPGLLTACLLALARCAGCEPGETCQPGQEQACTCRSGASGQQQCAPGGSAWTQCWCGAEDGGAGDGGACSAGQVPALTPSASSLDFGDVRVGQRSSRTLTLSSSGACSLVVDAVAFASGSAPELRCPSCAALHLPASLAPGSALALELEFAPTMARPFEARLQVRSDDPGLPDGLLEVLLTGRGLGPRLDLEPAVIDFGFVAPNDPPAQRTVTARNGGSEPLLITRVFVDPPQATSGMQVAPTVEALDPPVQLAAGGQELFTVTFDPASVALHRATLYLAVNDAGRTCPTDPQATPGIGCVELIGDARQPPQIDVQPVAIAFGALDVGQHAEQMVTVSNTGQADLQVSLRMAAGSSTDFGHSLLSVSRLLPGTHGLFTATYDATEVGAVQGSVEVRSNDPAQPVVVVALSATGLAVAGADTLKVEMVFDNGVDGVLSGDFRDVDLDLESPFGELVDEDSPSPDWSHGGGDPARDFGHPRWEAAGAVEEPERITLLDVDSGATGTFKACVSYREDCAFVPTDLLASLLGMGVSALLGELSSGSIQPDSEELAAMVRDNCWSHDASTATLQVFVNGLPIATRQVTLPAAGDRACPVVIQRVRGLFCVEGASQVGCD